VNTERSPLDELNLLREKRGMLEQAVKIAEAIEHLHHGLMAVVLLGKPTNLISKKAIATFEVLDGQTQMLPSDQLHEILKKLEDTVQQKLATILQISKLGDGAFIDAKALEGEELAPTILLREYQKLAQTAVAVRVLLHTRGEGTSPVSFAIPENDIRHKIAEIKLREQGCRTKVKQEITQLIQDTEQLLIREDLPEEMQAILEALRESCRQNLEHMEAGGSLQVMPVSIEIIEVEDTEEAMRWGALSPTGHNSQQREQLQRDSSPNDGFFGKIKHWAKRLFS